MTGNKKNDKKIVAGVLIFALLLVIVGMVVTAVKVNQSDKVMPTISEEVANNPVWLSKSIGAGRSDYFMILTEAYGEDEYLAIEDAFANIYPDMSSDEIKGIVEGIDLEAVEDGERDVISGKSNFIDYEIETVLLENGKINCNVTFILEKDWEKVVTILTDSNTVVNDFAWGWFGLILLLGTGLICTLITKAFQVVRVSHWWGKTIGSVFKKDTHIKTQKGAVSQFQALCTALAATIGTGNIAGVSAAICVGGPGAVFWMWIAAILGMMTNFSENILGIYYRRKNDEGEWSGGAMYYLEDGLGSYKGMKVVGKVLAVIFAVFAMLASFGIGNMGQINKITLNVESAFFSDVSAPSFLGASVVNWVIGVVLMIVGGFIILGGLKRIAAFAEKVVPFMALVYIAGALIIVIMHITSLGEIFAAIFKYAWGVKAVGGAATGIVIKEVIMAGCKRGVFSNEAGLGSSVMVHSNSTVKEPVKQGLWGIFEVFADTIVVCTMTAIVVLSSGAIDLSTGLTKPGTQDATLVAQSFGKAFGKGGEWFIAIAVLLFAFTTVLGWSHYGSKAVEYIFGVKGAKVYRIVFVLMMISGAIMTSSLAWDISDTFNGLMMIPNLIGVLSLTPLVVKLTNNYVARKIKGDKSVEPMLSYDPSIQAEHAKYVKETGED